MANDMLFTAITNVRAQLSVTYFHSATFTHKVAGTPDADGQPTKGTPTTTTIACYLYPLAPQSFRGVGIVVNTSGVEDKGRWMLTAPYGTTLKVNDTFTAVDEANQPIAGGAAFRVVRDVSEDAQAAYEAEVTR